MVWFGYCECCLVLGGAILVHIVDGLGVNIYLLCG